MEGELQVRVGRNLRAYRLAHGLSQEAFADAVGVHRNLTLKSLERIAELINHNPLDLLRP